MADSPRVPLKHVSLVKPVPFATAVATSMNAKDGLLVLEGDVVIAQARNAKQRIHVPLSNVVYYVIAD